YLTNRPDGRHGPGDPATDVPDGHVETVPPGVHGLSNHLLDTPWPKVDRGRRELEALLRRDTPPSPDELISLLLDRTYAADHQLPSTGVPLELERALSARLIVTPEFGTRSSTA